MGFFCEPNSFENSECFSVDRAGSADISPSIQIKNYLLFSSLSHKLLSISQLVKELNFTVFLFY